jgi:hypothetical protein
MMSGLLEVDLPGDGTCHTSVVKEGEEGATVLSSTYLIVGDPFGISEANEAKINLSREFKTLKR